MFAIKLVAGCSAEKSGQVLTHPILIFGRYAFSLVGSLSWVVILITVDETPMFAGSLNFYICISPPVQNKAMIFHH